MQPVKPKPVKPKPVVPYQPNPQTDQSHPIEQQQQPPIKEQIKPNPPEKYNDTEIKNKYEQYHNNHTKQIENFKKKFKVSNQYIEILKD